MSRLDQHVGLVRFRLTLANIARALPLAGTIFAILLLGVITAQHISRFALPRPQVWFWVGVGVSVGVSMLYGILRRPTAHQAAVAIDERLGLNEKFSTALYVRASRDPFAAAAVNDAEKAAATANLGDKFPIRLPQRSTISLFVAVVAAIIVTMCPHADWFPPSPAKANPTAYHAISRPAAEQLARQVIAAAEAAPPAVMEDEHVKMAVGEMQKAVDQHIADPVQTERKAQDLLKDIAAIKQKIAESNKFATTKNELRALEDVSAPSPEETGPVADAQRDLAEKNVDKAVDDLQKAVKNFNNMDKKEQEKAAEQMKNLANEIQKKADDPKVQQEVQKQLEQAGVDKDQAKKMTDMMKNAANGDQNAAKQLQQMANQAAQQANQQSGMTQQQQQAVANAIKKSVQNGQQKTNQQANAQQMAQATQNLASTMKQAAQAAQQQGQQSQQANGGQKSGQQQGQKAQANGSQPGQQGQGAGQPGAGQGASQQQLQQQMQQQVSQLGAMAKDQQGVAAAQQQAGQGQNGQDGQGSQGQQGQGAQANAGQWGQGNGQGQDGQPNQQGGQPGQANGGAGGVGGRRPDPTFAPFRAKAEYSESQTNEEGRIIAKSFVKAPSERGTSTIKMGQAIDSESKADAGEVDTDRIPRSAQKAVKDYFDTLKQADGSGK